MKKYFFYLLILMPVGIFAQEQKSEPNTVAKNAVFIAGIDNGSVICINYDRIFLANPDFKMSFRLGAGYFPSDIVKSIFPDKKSGAVEVNFLFGSGHYFEIGTGVAYCYALRACSGCLPNSYVSSTIFSTFRVGYRFQRKPKGLFLRFGLGPMIPLYEFSWQYKNDPLYKYDKYAGFIGIGIGYAF